MLNKKQLVWFISIRMVVVSFFLVSTIILNIKEPESVTGFAFTALIKLISVTYLFSVASLFALRITDRFSQAFSYIQVVWDLLLVTLLLIFTGGISSPYSFLYILSIINASVLLSRREAYLTASLCGILYGAILDFQFYGKLVFLGLSPFSAQQHGANYIFYTISLNILAYYLTAFLAGHLTERARKSENALQEKVVDYEELATLNSSIVSTIASGLLTVNCEMRIGVFNRYAEQFTGVSQRDAYDRLLTDVIPGLAPFLAVFTEPQKGEFFFERPGGTRVVGFNALPLKDHDGKQLGAVVDFHDLTHMKQMEMKLQKADRLAAVGELSARIAHEIRNPLASISGAVQLIAQGDNTGDRRLLAIVLRETDRLNDLIKDFLEYARPSIAVKVDIVLKNLVDDLVALLVADSRFQDVLIMNSVPEDIRLSFDLDQLKQVFWNLTVNAAEAMPLGGQIEIDAEVIHDNFEELIPARDAVKITVKDTGNGMAPEDVKRVFDPFFTTKPGGTGLGLATVYRVVEAQGGMIAVSSNVGCGTIFTLYLPAIM